MKYNNHIKRYTQDFVSQFIFSQISSALYMMHSYVISYVRFYNGVSRVAGFKKEYFERSLYSPLGFIPDLMLL